VPNFREITISEKSGGVQGPKGPRSMASETDRCPNDRGSIGLYYPIEPLCRVAVSDVMSSRKWTLNI